MKMTENTKTVYRNVVGAFSVKGAALILSLFTTPAYIRYFNNEDGLGLWFTLLSVLSWVLSFDLGIGNGLRNKLTVSLVRGDTEESKKYVSTTYVCVGAITAAVILLFTLVAQWIDWNVVFNVGSDVVDAKSLRLSVVLVFGGIMLQFFFKIINSVLYALQKSSVNNLLSLITSILIFCYVFFARGGSNAENLIAMAIVHSVAVILPLVVASIAVFGGKYKRISPHPRSFEFAYIKDILSLGGQFFYLQILYMVMISTNEYLITLFMNAGEVVEYQVYYRFYSLGSIAFALALTPIWSVVTKAISEGDIKWVKSLYHKILLLGGLATLGEFCITPVLQLLFNLFYAENAYTVNYPHAVLWSLMGSLLIFNAAFSSITNGMGRLRGQFVSFTAAAILKVPLSYLFVSWFGSYIGVVAATAVVLLIYCIIEPIYIRSIFKS